MKADEITINSDLTLAEAIADIRRQYLKDRYIILTVRTGKQRTLTQNRALHLWMGMLADLLNASGLDMRKVLKPSVDIPWSTVAVKEFIWRPVQEAAIHKESTTKADRIEYTTVYDILARHFAQKHGLSVPEWPKKKDDTE